MQNLFSTLKYKFQTKPIIFITIFIIIFIILPIMATLIYFNFKPNKFGPETKINGLNQSAPYLTLEQKNFLNNQLYEIIKKNNPNLSNITKLQANIIKKSLQNHPTNDKNSTEFTIDIPEIKQSFIAKINLSKKSSQNIPNSYSILILCPSKTNLIYPNQKCHDNYKTLNYLDLKNDYQLDYTFSRGVNIKFKQIISPILLKKFKNSIKDHQISASVDESTIKEIDSQTYSFDLLIDNNRLNFIIYMDKKYGKQYLVIYFSSTSGDFTNVIIATNKKSTFNKLKKWSIDYFKISDETLIKLVKLPK